MESKSNIYTLFASAGVFLFYALNQSVPSGYSLGAALLFLTSAVYLFRRPVLTLTGEEKICIASMVGFFSVAVFIYVLHGNPVRTLDIPSRFLLAIPVFLLLIHRPPRLTWFWSGVAVGSYGACGVALWQTYVEGRPDVDGLTNGVRYGGVCTMLAILGIAGLLWARRENVQRVWLWRTVLTLGILSAGYGSIMSGTRGAWISIPLVFVLFCLGTFTRRHLFRACMVALAPLAIAVAWYVAVPNNPVQTGYDQAVHDIQDYVQNGNAKGSIGGRFELWRAALMNIPAKPVFGWGMKDYQEQLQRQIANKELAPRILDLSHTHNLYLETLLHQGLLGLIPILALFIFPFWFFCRRLYSPRRNVRILAIAGASQLVVFGMLGMSHTVLYRNDTLLFFFITVMVLWGCMRAEEGQPE